MSDDFSAKTPNPNAGEEAAFAAALLRGSAWDDSDPSLRRAITRAAEVVHEHGVAAEAAQLLASGNDVVEVVAAAVFGVCTAAYRDTGAAVFDDLLPLLVAAVLDHVVSACDDAGVEVDVELDDVLPAMNRLVQGAIVEHDAVAASASADTAVTAPA